MKRSKLFIIVAGVSFAFGVTSIAYADSRYAISSSGTVAGAKDPACHQREPEHGSADDAYRLGTSSRSRSFDARSFFYCFFRA